MIRLDRDKEAYDFVKWWLIEGFEVYDWAQETEITFLDLKSADVFEDPANFLDDRYTHMYGTVSRVIGHGISNIYALSESRANMTSEPQRDVSLT